MIIIRRYLFLAATALLIPLAAFAAGPRDIRFADILWGLRQTAGPVAPGPNTFSNAADQVWVDEAGRAHLMVKKVGDVWMASEMMAKEDAEYGTYRFEVEGSIASLDPQLVFGFFTWDVKAGETNREIDIEISRWGNPEGPNGWFTVQPYDVQGNQLSFFLAPAKTYAFELRWEPGLASFSCLADGNPCATWSFRGSQVPDPGRARLRLNFWLFQGKAPRGPGPYEVVISNLRYEPLR